jgi:hypothetical protein
VSAPLAIKSGGSSEFNDYRVAHQNDFQLRADRYWELVPGQSIQAGLDASSQNDRAFHEYVLRTGYSANLLSLRNTIQSGDLRFEAHLSRDYLAFPGEATRSRGIADIGLAFRNSWGLVRFDFEYTGLRRPK